MCSRSAQCAAVRTTCFMTLLGTEPHDYGVEVCGRRQRDARGFVTDVNRARLLGVGSVFLIGLDRDPIRTERHGLTGVIQAVPYQLILPGRSRGPRDRSELIEVPVNVIPQR